MTRIKEGMDFDDWQRTWTALCLERGHTLKMDGASVDYFVESEGFHNGPGCTKCGWSACMHCDFEGKKIPVCK